MQLNTHLINKNNIMFSLLGIISLNTGPFLTNVTSIKIGIYSWSVLGYIRLSHVPEKLRDEIEMPHFSTKNNNKSYFNCLVTR